MATKNIEVKLRLTGDEFSRGMAKGRFELTAAKTQFQQLEAQGAKSMRALSNHTGKVSQEFLRMQKSGEKMFNQTFGRGVRNAIDGVKDLVKWTGRLAVLGGGAMYAKSAMDWLKVSRQSAEIQNKLGNLDYSKEKDPTKRASMKIAAATEMKSYRDFAYETAQSTGKDVSEILDSIKESAASGVKSKAGMQEIARLSAMAAQTDSTASVSDLTKGAILLLGKKVNDPAEVKQFFDRLLTMQDLGMGGIAENVAALSTAQSSFKDALGGADRIPGMMGTFATMTTMMDSPEAATSIGRMMDAFKKPDTIAKLAANDINVFDKAGSMRTTDDIIGDFQKKLRGKSEKDVVGFLDDMGLDQIRAMRGIVNLLGATDTLKGNIEEVAKASGKTEAAFEIMSENTAVKLDRLGQKVKVMGLKFQEAADPFYGGLLDIANGEQVDAGKIGMQLKKNFREAGLGDNLSDMLGGAGEGVIMKVQAVANDPDGVLNLVKELALKGFAAMVTVKFASGALGGLGTMAGQGIGNAAAGMFGSAYATMGGGGMLVAAGYMAAPLVALVQVMRAVADAATSAKNPIDFLGKAFQKIQDYTFLGIADQISNMLGIKPKTEDQKRAEYTKDALARATNDKMMQMYANGLTSPEKFARKEYGLSDQDVASKDQQDKIDWMVRGINSEIQKKTVSPLGPAQSVASQSYLGDLGPKPTMNKEGTMSIDSSLATSLAKSSDIQALQEKLGPLQSIQNNTARTLSSGQYMSGVAMITGAIRGISISVITGANAQVPKA